MELFALHYVFQFLIALVLFFLILGVSGLFKAVTGAIKAYKTAEFWKRS
jgi:hypothetical protein